MKIIKKMIGRKTKLALIAVLAALLFPVLQATPASAGTNGHEVVVHVYQYNWVNGPQPAYVQVCGYNQNNDWRCNTWGLSGDGVYSNVRAYKATTWGWYFKSAFGKQVELTFITADWRYAIGFKRVYVPELWPSTSTHYHDVYAYTYEW